MIGESVGEAAKNLLKHVIAKLQKDFATFFKT